ncbi:ADL162Wp [Eremothecium gossypii ATCC 10895]|uniref:ADL162Wp n=1 Tax=Eremothecium gossypii (strain ATCC 10895 / CBS 109.51 / FGSC 9923 / NRRL Y-1056) TaxID=284811 RepID=Q75AT2_EREGS|nr:ADL162Wp [Eremothecium gossypii ATCC 10895]AAS51758.2 ADL162Wp [Eremothecium gossypii ATCC 10895]AEY96055.1 FADL162Wp [Eremothecium gossypii FDAG1]
MSGKRKLYVRTSSEPTSPQQSHVGVFGETVPLEALRRRVITPSRQQSMVERHVPAVSRARDTGLEYTDGAHASSIKLLLIGNAGVGKTAMILSYSNELPTKSQLWQQSPQLAAPNIDQRTKKRLKTVDARKRYSLNDYEELFARDARSIEDAGREDGDEVVIETKSTIGVDIKTSFVDIDRQLFKVIMWDTAGQERYRNAMVPSLYKGTQGIILSYDICSRETFRDCLEHWLPEALEHCQVEHTRFYLVGNKVDLYKQRQVTHADVLAFADEAKRRYGFEISGKFELSCKWQHVVERAFSLIIKDLVEHGCYEDNFLDTCTDNNDEDDDNYGATMRDNEEHDDDEADTCVCDAATNLPGMQARKLTSAQGRRSPESNSRNTNIDITKPIHKDGSPGAAKSSCCS